MLSQLKPTTLRPGTEDFAEKCRWVLRDARKGSKEIRTFANGIALHHQRLSGLDVLDGNLPPATTAQSSAGRNRPGQSSATAQCRDSKCLDSQHGLIASNCRSSAS
nr:hypothetical protein Iba_chr14cCG2310 [Ipomoea batatas]